VSADWLWISVQSGKRKVFDPYVLHKSNQKNEAKHEQSKSARNSSGITHKSSLSQSEAHADSHTRQTSFASSETDDPTAGEARQLAKPSVSNRQKASLSSVSQPPTEESDNKDNQRTEKAPPEDSGTSVHSHRSSENLESSMNRFLKKARELTRARSILGGEKRRPNLGRTNSSSSRNEFKRTDSRVSVSSIDTMNEDGYGSAVSADTDANNPLTAKLSRNFTGQSLSSLLSSNKFTRYIDSPIPEKEELLDENSAPAMTQLNYEDPNAMAAREEIMRLARRGNVDEAHVTGILKQKEPIEPQAVIDEFPQLVDKQGGRMTARRTRRSAGKQHDDDFL
jgi:DNA replication regulator DPB11